MPIGRKKKTTDIQAPPPVSSVSYTSPLGDVFTTVQRGARQLNQVTLSPGSQRLVEDSRLGMQQSVNELGVSTPERLQQIRDRGADFYSGLADVINEESGREQSKLRSQMAQRFGGSLGATFGNDLLARQENNRLRRLTDARQQAGLLGEDLYREDEADRTRRLNAFQNVVNSFQNTAFSSNQLGSTILGSERSRLTDIGLARARMLQQASENANQRADNLAAQLIRFI
jgi:hypothetical protein